MDIVTDRARDPFGMDFPCAAAAPGFGDANADFHVIGDHPGVHGGSETGLPFTGMAWSAAFFDALADGWLLDPADARRLAAVTDPDCDVGPIQGTYFSHLHACVPEGDEPDERDYAASEPVFDAELRAITADVLLPVGARATEHVLAEYTARDPSLATEMDAIHGRELVGSGWLVVPMKTPADWRGDDARRLLDALGDLTRTDYRRRAELGRFLVGGEPYYVR